MNKTKTNDSINSRMSPEEIDSLLASELEKVGLSSPCTPDLFYATMNGQNVDDNSGGPKVQVPIKNISSRDSVTDTTCSDVSDLTDDDSRARRRKAREAVERRRNRIQKKKQTNVDIDFDPESCLALSTDSHKPSSSRTRHSLANENDASNSSTSKQSKVSFSTIDVRHYERIIELNPAVSSGVPIGIGWRYKRGGEISVEEFERHHSRSYKPEELLIPRAIRESMVKEFGYSQKDIADATRTCLRLKKERKQTVDNLHFQRVEEKFESASRKMINAITFGDATKRG